MLCYSDFMITFDEQIAALLDTVCACLAAVQGKGARLSPASKPAAASTGLRAGSKHGVAFIKQRMICKVGLHLQELPALTILEEQEGQAGLYAEPRTRHACPALGKMQLVASCGHPRLCCLVRLDVLVAYTVSAGLGSEVLCHKGTLLPHAAGQAARPGCCSQQPVPHSLQAPCSVLAFLGDSALQPARQPQGCTMFKCHARDPSRNSLQPLQPMDVCTTITCQRRERDESFCSRWAQRCTSGSGIP